MSLSLLIVYLKSHSSKTPTCIHPHMHAIACSREEITHIRTNGLIRVTRDHLNVHLRCTVTVGQLNIESQVSALFLSFSSRFSFHMGSPEWYCTSFFHFVLSSASSPFNPTVSTCLVHESFHLMCFVSFLVLVHLAVVFVRALRP